MNAPRATLVPTVAHGEVLCTLTGHRLVPKDPAVCPEPYLLPHDVVGGMPRWHEITQRLLRARP